MSLPPLPMTSYLQECSGGLVLQGGKCESPCPPQRFYANPTCLPCHYSCKSCSGPNDYECMDCFEDSTPSRYHTANQTAAKSSFRCIPSDVFQALYSERWSFWLLITFLCNAVLSLFVLALLCCQRCSKGHHKHGEGHNYKKLGISGLLTSDGKEVQVVGCESSEEDEVS